GRDLFRGRIYRLVHEQGKTTAMPDVSADNAASLLQALQSDNMFWRLTAQRLIVQHRLDGLADELVNLIQQDTVDAIHTNGPALHAVWTLAGLGLLDGRYPQYLDEDRKSTRLNSSHVKISYAVFCLKKKKKQKIENTHMHHKNIY